MRILSLGEVIEKIEKNNANAGGNILEKHAEKYIVRGRGLIRSLEDIERIVVKEVGGTPVFVGDIANVVIGHAVRHGATLLNGERMLELFGQVAVDEQARPLVLASLDDEAPLHVGARDLEHHHLDGALLVNSARQVGQPAQKRRLGAIR